MSEIKTVENIPTCRECGALMWRNGYARMHRDGTRPIKWACSRCPCQSKPVYKDTKGAGK